MKALNTSPRQAADLLSRLADALSEGAALKEEGGEAVKQLVDRLVSAFKETLPSSPGDLAAKLASLVQDINGRQGPLDKELTQLLQQLTAKMLRGNGAAGSNGNTPGAGGGELGKVSGVNTSYPGGSGARGEIRLTYTSTASSYCSV